MIGRRWPRLGVFGRTYGLMLGTVLGAEALIFPAIVLTAPPVPPIIEFDLITGFANGKAVPEKDLPVRIRTLAAPPERPDDRASMALSQAIERHEGLAAGSVIASVSAIGPPSTFGTRSVEAVFDGAKPIIVAGEFSVAVRQPDGRWRLVETDGSLAAAAALRIALLLLGTLALVLPVAYFLARRTTRPISRFARAADQLGRDPHAPPVEESGPEEIRMASEAFNKMQQRLNSYVEERTTMVAAVAHDLRTPLMRIAFELEEAPPAIQNAVNTQIREMRTMIDAIMRFLRAEQSRHGRDDVELLDMLETIVAEFHREGASVLLTSDVGEVRINCDTVGMKSVFRNVIGNAIAYGHEVDVALNVEDGRVVVLVRDRGPGLSEDDLQRVFQPFYRVEKSRNRQTGGIGLGLAVARSIVAAHGGRITLANRAEGGLEARIELPLPREFT